MSVFVLEVDRGTGRWSNKEFKSRPEALDHINQNIEPDSTFQVIEGVRLKLEPVTQVTQYQFARGT
jgi:hypothetical protein